MDGSMQTVDGKMASLVPLTRLSKSNRQFVWEWGHQGQEILTVAHVLASTEETNDPLMVHTGPKSHSLHNKATMKHSH